MRNTLAKGIPFYKGIPFVRYIPNKNVFLFVWVYTLRVYTLQKGICPFVGYIPNWEYSLEKGIPQMFCLDPCLIHQSISLQISPPLFIDFPKNKGGISTEKFVKCKNGNRAAPAAGCDIALYIYR